jgi:hypothetical protein
MPTWGDARVVGIQFACEGLEKGRLARPGHSAQTQVGVDKHPTDKVDAVAGGARPGGSGVWGTSEDSGILKRKQGIGKEIDLVGDAGVESGGNKNDVRSIMGEGGG